MTIILYDTVGCLATCRCSAKALEIDYFFSSDYNKCHWETGALVKSIHNIKTNPVHKWVQMQDTYTQIHAYQL